MQQILVLNAPLLLSVLTFVGAYFVLLYSGTKKSRSQAA